MDYGYVRVSTKMQEDSGLGLEAQRAAIERMFPGAMCFEDVCSGATPMDERPGFIELVQAAKDGDRVIVTRLDRFARDMSHHLFIETLFKRTGVTLVSVAGEGVGDDSPIGTLMRQVLQAFAQFERSLVRVRTRSALQARAARGLPKGGRAPYGHRWVNGELVPDEHKLELLDAVREAKASGRKLSEVAAEFDQPVKRIYNLAARF